MKNTNFILKSTCKLGALLLCIVLAFPIQCMASSPGNEPFWPGYEKLYLYPNGIGGLTRVWVDDLNPQNGIIKVEELDSQYVTQVRHEILRELDLFGGFFSGAEYNYMIFGQRNNKEDDNVEVIRVVKYSKNWERLGQRSIYGANTKVPFQSGSCRCAEAGGILYIRTCHEMYKSKDGLNHQANMMLAIRENDMILTDWFCGVEFENRGYVSHSFDQYVITDKEGNIVTLDLGDGFPRAIVLHRYNGRAGREKFGAASRAIILNIPGSIGDNYTGVTIGGFAETDTGYVTAYSYKNEGTRSVYLAYTSKSDLSTRTVPLSAPGVDGSAPALAPLGTSGGYIIWQDPNMESEDRVLYYAAYSADGSIGEFHTANSFISSLTMPINYNGKIVWNVLTKNWLKADGEASIITDRYYQLDDMGLSNIKSEDILYQP